MRNRAPPSGAASTRSCRDGADDALGDREAEAGAARLAGENGSQMRSRSQTHAGTGVADLDHEVVARRARANRRTGRDRVLEEVDEDLAHARGSRDHAAGAFAVSTAMVPAASRTSAAGSVEARASSPVRTNASRSWVSFSEAQRLRRRRVSLSPSPSLLGQARSEEPRVALQRREGLRISCASTADISPRSSRRSRSRSRSCARRRSLLRTSQPAIPSSTRRAHRSRACESRRCAARPPGWARPRR